MRPVRKIGFGASYQNQNQTSLGQLSFLVLPYGPPRDESWGRVTSDRMVCGTPWISLELGPARGAQGLWATPDTSIRKKRSCSSGSICRRFGRKYERKTYWGLLILSGTFPLRNHFYHFLSDHDRSADCYWLRLDVFIATGIMWFTSLDPSLSLTFEYLNWIS